MWCGVCVCVRVILLILQSQKNIRPHARHMTHLMVRLLRVGLWGFGVILTQDGHRSHHESLQPPAMLSNCHINSRRMPQAIVCYHKSSQTFLLALSILDAEA